MSNLPLPSNQQNINEADCLGRIVGIGNRFRNDDGVGPGVIDLLKQYNLPSVKLHEVNDDLTDLIQTWSKDETVILIDAVQSGSPVGRIHHLDLLHANQENLAMKFSTHSFNPFQIARLAMELNLLPHSLYLFGIEAADFSYGEKLGPEVQESMKIVVDHIAKKWPDGFLNGDFKIG